MKKLMMLCLALVCALSFVGCQKSNPRLSVSALQEQFDPKQFTVKSVVIGEWEFTDEVENLSQILCFEEWAPTAKGAEEELRLTVVLSEEYELRIYSSYVQAYDGYALIGETNSAFYKISDTANEKINTYLTEKAPI